MDTNRGCGRWFSRSFVSLLIAVISMSLLLSGLPSYSYELNFWFLAIVFIPLAFLLGLLLLYFIELGFGLFAGDMSDKVCGFLLIGVALCGPFVWASWEGIWRYNYLPFPSWIIPLTASVMLLLWSGFEFALTKVAEHEEEKA